jgi:hypothetical protein
MKMTTTGKLQIVWDSLWAGIVVLILDFDDKRVLAEFATGFCGHPEESHYSTAHQGRFESMINDDGSDQTRPTMTASF